MYIKYPYHQKYWLEVGVSYNKNKKKYKNKLETLIPKKSEDQIMYRDGYCVNMVDLD